MCCPTSGYLKVNKPGLPFGIISLGVWVILCAVLLSGCIAREEVAKEVQTEQVTTKTQTTTAPVVVESPIGQITVQPAKVEQVQTVERRQVTDTQARAETSANVPPQIAQAVPAVASGAIGLIPGLGGLVGLAVGIWGWFGRAKTLGTLGAVVQGVEDFKADSADGHTVEKLNTTLSRKMDRSHKQLVKSLKG